MTTKTTLTLADLLHHDAPWFDLASEPWIGVIDVDGASRRLSLRDVLIDADRIARLDDATVGALGTHALTRLLLALTYLLHAHTPDHPWQQVADGQAPLPTEAVDATLARLADHLWLEHPDTPFLQTPGVLAHMAARPNKDPARQLLDATHSYWTLLPDVPSKSNPSWFNREHELPTPTAADVANALVVRHYFALPGNEADNTAAGGRSSKGGPAGLTHNGRSYVTRTASTLASTLVVNLLPDWLRTITPASPTFWEQPNDIAANLANPLWCYTASAAATFAVRVSSSVDPTGWRAVRTPAPVAKAQAAALKEAMVANDPHTLRIDPADAKLPRSYVTFSPDAHPYANVRRFHAKAAGGHALHAPTALARTRYRTRSAALSWLHVSGGGSATGPTITGTSTTVTGIDEFLFPAERAERFVELADRLVGNAKSVASQTAYRIRQVMRTDHKQAPTIADEVRDRLYADASRELADLLAVCADTDQPLPDDVPGPVWDAVAHAALRTYDDLAGRFETSPASRARVVEHRHALRSYLFRKASR